MKKAFICVYIILGIGVAGCSKSSVEETRPAIEKKAVDVKPKEVSSTKNDHHKISFDGYRLGDKFEDKGHKGHPFVHKNQYYHFVQLDQANTLSITTLGNGTIVSISKNYFIDELKDFSGKFAIKSNIELKPITVMGITNMYRGTGKDLLVEIRATELSTYMERINDIAGQIVVDVSSPFLIKKLEEEIKNKNQARLEQAAQSFEF